MATAAPLARPQLYQTANPVVFQRAAVSDGSNSFAYGQFVKLAAGALAKYVADDTIIYGLTPDASHASTDEPYQTPWGENHNPISLSGQTFLMNITDASGTVGSGSTTQNDVGLGSRYSARYLGSVDTDCLAIDAADGGTASKHIFQVVQKYPYDAADDYNGRVMVTVIPSAQFPSVAT